MNIMNDSLKRNRLDDENFCIYSFVVGAVLANPAFAENTVAAVPKNLHIYSEGGNAYVGIPNKGCSNKGTYQLGADHKSYSEIYKTLL